MNEFISALNIFDETNKLFCIKLHKSTKKKGSVEVKTQPATTYTRKSTEHERLETIVLFFLMITIHSWFTIYIATIISTLLS